MWCVNRKFQVLTSSTHTHKGRGMHPILQDCLRNWTNVGLITQVTHYHVNQVKKYICMKTSRSIHGHSWSFSPLIQPYLLKNCLRILFNFKHLSLTFSNCLSIISSILLPLIIFWHWEHINKLNTKLETLKYFSADNGNCSFILVSCFFFNISLLAIQFILNGDNPEFKYQLHDWKILPGSPLQQHMDGL